jgi:hypothetical protein
MRRRINRTLLTATAASASVITLGFMATGAVGAATTTTAGLASTSSVTPILSNASTCVRPANTALAATPATPLPCAVAGYQASGRLFRYAQASIVVPNHAAAFTYVTTGSPQVEPDGAAYVALDNSSDTANDYARVGIVACAAITHTSSVIVGVWPCPGTAAGGSDVAAGWYVFAAVSQPDGGATSAVTHLLDATQQGLGVFASVYLSPTGNSVHTVIKTPTTYSSPGVVHTQGHTYNDTFLVNGPTYTNADAVADWTGISGLSGFPVTAPFQPNAGVTAGYPGTVAYTQFKDGRFTTWGGTKGTFNGKWTVTPFEATIDGTSLTAIVTSPGFLWSSTTGYKSDAFGVWLRHV